MFRRQRRSMWLFQQRGENTKIKTWINLFPVGRLAQTSFQTENAIGSSPPIVADLTSRDLYLKVMRFSVSKTNFIHLKAI